MAKKESKVWQVFACIGFWFSVGTIVTFWKPILAFNSFGPAFVFSILGFKSTKYRSIARTGLIFSILSLIFTLIVYFSNYQLFA